MELTMKTNLKFGIVMAILVVCGTMPNFGFAAVITSQDVHSDSVINGSAFTFHSQTLGTGLTGNLASISLWLEKALGSRATTTLQLQECPDNTYTSCTATSTGNIASMASSDKIYVSSAAQYFYNFQADFPLNASKYYQFLVQMSPNDSLRVYGSNSAASYTNGAYDLDTATLKDAYFFLFGSANLVSQSITINNPTYGEVIADTDNVLFDFDYYINSVTYDKAGFTLVDNTSLQSFDTSSLEDTVNSSGSSNYSAYVDLISGHNYTWTPYLENSSTTARTYGSPTLFFAGSQGNQSIPNSPTPLWNGCTNILCPGAIFSTSTGLLTWNGGTTTSPFGPFGETLDSLLANKAPFSYLYDIKQVLFELGNGSTTDIYNQSCTRNDAYYTLPSGTFGTTLSNGSTTVKFIDACAIKEMSIVKEIRKAMTYAIYLITGIGLTGMALSII